MRETVPLDSISREAQGENREGGSVSIIKKARQHYVVRVDVGKDPFTGNRVRIDRTVRGPRLEAEALEAELKSQRNRGQLVMPSKATLKDVLEDWLAAKYVKVGPRTHERYTSLVRASIVPALGAVRVQDLQPEHIQKFYAESLKTVSATTVRHRHVALKSALKRALGRKLISSNPADYVEVPKPSRKEIRTITAAEARMLLDHVKGSSLEVPVRLALDTGMRLSEVLGLRWSDIDDERRCLMVRQAALELSSKGTGVTFKEPKSASGTRAIDLDDRTLSFLRAHRKTQNETRLLVGQAWAKNDLVICNEVGEPVRPSTVSRHFGRASKRSGLGCRFHDLRHTNATMALAAGEHVDDVAQRLGHSDSSFTYRVYSHPTRDGNRRVATTVANEIHGIAEAL